MIQEPMTPGLPLEHRPVKHKVSELEGALLDAAVALAHGWTFVIEPARPTVRTAAGAVIARPAICLATVPDLEHGDGNGLVGFAPSASWEHGGPLIERERIAVLGDDNAAWAAGWQTSSDAEEVPPGFRRVAGECWQAGPTALVAAMRAYVASKFGDEVELP